MLIIVTTDTKGQQLYA